MYFVDAAFNSINKYGEELCGDNIEQILLDDSKILVLSDGLGSGVKANILATMTSKIAATMLRQGSTIEETIDTLVHTLPICSERKLAYSTFTIIQVYKTGQVYVVEFDNPSIFIHRNGEDYHVEKTLRTIDGKRIYESNFKIDKYTTIVAVSDGVIHAGVGRILDLGWEWENVNRFLRNMSAEDKPAAVVAAKVLGMCQSLNNNKAGDDTTVLAIKIREQETINLFTGPPKDPDNDYAIIENILNSEGKVIVCGGTTANIVARTLGCEVEIDMSTMTPTIPPIGKIPRIELVTEGVITINKALELIKWYNSPEFNNKLLKLLKENNGASRLASILIEDCDNLNIWLGQDVNPAHQEASFPMGFDFKTGQIKELASWLEKMGKVVTIHYI